MGTGWMEALRQLASSPSEKETKKGCRNKDARVRQLGQMAGAS